MTPAQPTGRTREHEGRVEHEYRSEVGVCFWCVPSADDELLRLARAATPGWRRQGNVERYHVFVQHDDGIAPALGRVLLRMNENFDHETDAAFIAACTPDVVVRLVERLRAAEARANPMSDWAAREIAAIRANAK